VVAKSEGKTVSKWAVQKFGMESFIFKKLNDAAQISLQLWKTWMVV
jgi:hypothetical protein